jgi:hypothetical protein
MYHAWEMRNAKFCLENLKRRDQLEDVGQDGRIILEWILNTGFIWLRIGTNDRLL